MKEENKSEHYKEANRYEPYLDKRNAVCDHYYTNNLNINFCHGVGKKKKHLEKDVFV